MGAVGGSLMTARLGIYGGTFDPPHIGHLILAETAVESLNLTQVLFVPAADPPHKPAAAIRVSAGHRVAMVERAIADNPRFALSRIDLDRPGPHYSVDMLRLMQRQHPDAELIFLIGSDSLQALPTWSRPQELLALAQLGVMHRAHFQPDLTALEEAVPGVSKRIVWIDAPLVAIAASDLGERIAAGRSVRYQIPDSVLAYIDEHGLYRKQP